MSVGPYKTTITLGSGAFGLVKLATKKGSDQQFAIKCISKKKIVQARMGEQVMKEISVMKKLNNEFIVKIEDVLMSEDFVYIAMEYAEGGQLWDKVAKKGKLDENSCKKYSWQMCSALAYCHSYNICHRDIKPQNILLDKDDNVKLADFGFASIMEVEEVQKGVDKRAGFREKSRLSTIDEVMTENHIPEDLDEFEMSMETKSNDTKAMSTFCGTVSYMAPEIENQDKYFGDKADVWSLGIVIYVLLNGFMPFKENDTKKDTYKKRDMNKVALDFLSKMLVVLPHDRWSMVDLLKHPWLDRQLENHEDKFTLKVIPPSMKSPVGSVNSIDSQEQEEEEDGKDNWEDVFEFYLPNHSGLDTVVSSLREHSWKVKQMDEYLVRTSKIDGRMIMVTIIRSREDGSIFVRNSNMNRLECRSAMTRLKHILAGE